MLFRITAGTLCTLRALFTLCTFCTFCTLGASIALLFATPTLAQSLADLTDATKTVESENEIHIIGHYNTGVGTSDAASQGYITPKLSEARPMLRPGEVLEYVPGVSSVRLNGC